MDPTATYQLIAALLVGLGVAALVALGARSMRLRRARRQVRVVGIGSAGTNAVDAMARRRIGNVEFVALNSDVRALRRSSAGKKIRLGRSITNGLGTGGDAVIGQTAAREASDQIARALAGSEMVVLVAGLGGGTGSGAAPVVAQIAREQGALSVAAVTRPFSFEGRLRHAVAGAAELELLTNADAVSVFTNDRARDLVAADASADEAFAAVDEAVSRNVQELLNLVGASGRIDVDFADLRAVLGHGGAAVVGFGRATGESRAVDAARQAIAAAFPDGGMETARSVLLHVSGSRSLKLSELEAVSADVRAAAHPEANVAFGLRTARRLRNAVQVTLVATAFTPRTVAATLSEVEQAQEAAPAEDWQPVWLRDRSAEAPPTKPAYTRRSRRARVSSEAPAATS